MAYEAHSDEAMSGFESMMWDMERDPHLSSAFSNVTILDQPPDRAILRRRMTNALARVPRLRQRVVEGASPWQLPRFVDDEEVDLDYHLRWLDMGGEATRRDLYDLVAVLSRNPLDRSRPLWQFVVIEGLDDGRSAMLQRLHHTITDGEGGIRLSVEFLDFERNPPPPEPPRDHPDEDSTDAPAPPKTRSSSGRGDPPPEDPSQESRSGMAPPQQWPVIARDSFNSVVGGASQLLGTARSAGRQAMVGNRRSPLWTERSLETWFGTTTLNLADVLGAARAMDASVNDFFIAGAAAAAGRIHAEASMPVDELRVSMPVSTRHDRSAGGNAFSPTQMLVPTSDMAPRERIEAIHDIVVELRQEKAIAAMGGAANAVAAALPAPVVLRTGQYLTRAVDFVCSNVRAAPFNLFMGGALMQANYPVGPIAATAFNLTTMSYRGWLFLGLHVDTAAVEDPQHLLDVLDECYTEALAAAGVPRHRPDEF